MSLSERTFYETHPLRQKTPKRSRLSAISDLLVVSGGTLASASVPE
jgi:hypothetical protein